MARGALSTVTGEALGRKVFKCLLTRNVRVPTGSESCVQSDRLLVILFRIVLRLPISRLFFIYRSSSTLRHCHRLLGFLFANPTIPLNDEPPYSSAPSQLGLSRTPVPLTLPLTCPLSQCKCLEILIDSLLPLCLRQAIKLSESSWH